MFHAEFQKPFISILTYVQTHVCIMCRVGSGSNVAVVPTDTIPLPNFQSPFMGRRKSETGNTTSV
jgi:hypothetical protein